jgi:hypothetical protein
MHFFDASQWFEQQPKAAQREVRRLVKKYVKERWRCGGHEAQGRVFLQKGMRTTSADHAPRRGRPVAQVKVVSPELVEMDAASFEAMANVIRLEWDLASVLDAERLA